MANEVVRLYRGDTFIAQTTADATGKARFSVSTLGWAAGDVTLRATAEDTARTLPVSPFGAVTVKGKGPLWQDTFDRADGPAGNGWVPAEGYPAAYATISGNTLLSQGGTGFRRLKNILPVTVPPDFWMTVTIPHHMTTRQYWWIHPRYQEQGGGPRFGQGASADGFLLNNGTGVVTGGLPASWTTIQNHRLVFRCDGPRTTLFVDGQEYGYVDDPTVASLWGPSIALTGEAGAQLIDITLTENRPE